MRRKFLYLRSPKYYHGVMSQGASRVPSLHVSPPKLFFPFPPPRELVKIIEMGKTNSSIRTLSKETNKKKSTRNSLTSHNYIITWIKQTDTKQRHSRCHPHNPTFFKSHSCWYFLSRYSSHALISDTPIPLSLSLGTIDTSSEFWVLIHHSSFFFFNNGCFSFPGALLGHDRHFK